LLVAAKNWMGKGPAANSLAFLDREHRHAHTHHLSAFQRAVGDLKMLFSVRPLRKWSLLAPVGVIAASEFRRSGRSALAAAALTTAAAGQAATLAGFRNGQRPFWKTLAGRAQATGLGVLLGLLLWLAATLLGIRKSVTVPPGRQR
jgi:hypothetical protein